jgi:hypothetical protein
MEGSAQLHTSLLCDWGNVSVIPKSHTEYFGDERYKYNLTELFVFDGVFPVASERFVVYLTALSVDPQSSSSV